MGNRWAVRTFLVAGALLLAGAPAARAQVQAPPVVTATKTVTGTFEERGTVTYVITLTNTGGTASPDNPTDELVDVLPAGLTLVSSIATSGTLTNGTDLVTGRPQVSWNGAITVGTDVVITVTATIDEATEGDLMSNQATVRYDSDGGGDNDTTVMSDADAGGTIDPTEFTVAIVDPTVTIEQALVQPDPAPSEPVRFTVEFSEPVTGFDGNDVVRTGTAGATNALVTGDVPGTTFTVIVNGATSPGTVIASIPADAAVDDDGNGNEASTSVDNQVTLQAIGTTTSTTTASTSSTSTLLTGSTTTTAAVAGTGSLARTGSDEDGPLVAFLGYWLALGGAAAVAAAGWHRRRAS